MLVLLKITVVAIIEAARLKDVIAGHRGRGMGLHAQDQPQRPVRILKTPRGGILCLLKKTLRGIL
jgi:hypothetical protein